ncbi:hypothetical protein [Paraburkholderia hospita]|uniref:hypothetical protein n=1 Tax=Paraburkholderia hospita TaxID=169430 RepID=UPI0008A7F3C6|nr:hypothetical protein [Paraburkholderia hospita]SEI20751.1 hypothetical protein SAMN05192544_103811 [Paraburkholderia hospita]
MPGHFTHIYTARRVADHLSSGKVTDWPSELAQYKPEFCGEVMRHWEKFTAIGAIGPDLFYFSQDYNGKFLGVGPVPPTDMIMLSLQVYYFFDAAKEDDWEPLLKILDEVSSTMASLIRFLIQLQKIWNNFVEGWNRTIGPLVSSATSLLDAATGGLISQFETVITELSVALKALVEQEVLTFKDIFGGFNTCVQKGWDEKSFLWSDMSHYRSPSALCRQLVKQAENLKDGSDEGEQRFEQFLAFSLGYITHVGTDTIGHSFVNEQCGGPFRNHPQRHHLIESHIDSWNYSQTKPGKANAPDPWGATETYPDLSMSALWFAVQVTTDPDKDIQGDQRPAPLPDDPVERKKALDVDGDMPLWMAEGIVNALLATFKDKEHPLIFGGDSFQSSINQGLLTQVVKDVTGHALDRPFDDLLKAIAPAPPFEVKRGFPLPWQIQTIYKIMISFYKLSFNGSWELQKPRKPDFIITPPASDIENLLQPPDFSGADSGNPVEDICSDLIALADWAVKELEAAVQLAEDILKMAASPGSYVFRLALYELAMMVWDVAVKTHLVLTHTGFLTPHSEQTYDDGELRLPDEIDLPLITLGQTVDSAFRDALDAAIDPFANLDKDQAVIGDGHPLPDDHYPYYPVLRTYRLPGGKVRMPLEPWEYHRPWAYPTWSPVTTDGTHNTSVVQTATETYDPSKSDFSDGTPTGAYRPLRAGPYPPGTLPNVFFRLDSPVNPEIRSSYESAQTPWATDKLNETYLLKERVPRSPLGDPVPFSAYLIGRLANETGYSAQFNLDSDRAFAYLNWDWVRDANNMETPDLGTDFNFAKPVIPPAGAKEWHVVSAGNPPKTSFIDPPLPLQLRYPDSPEEGPKPPPIK